MPVPFYTYRSSSHTTLKQHHINVNVTSWCHIDVDTTLFRRHVPAGKDLGYAHSALIRTNGVVYRRLFANFFWVVRFLKLSQDIYRLKDLWSPFLLLEYGTLHSLSINFNRFAHHKHSERKMVIQQKLCMIHGKTFKKEQIRNFQ